MIFLLCVDWNNFALFIFSYTKWKCVLLVCCHGYSVTDKTDTSYVTVWKWIINTTTNIAEMSEIQNFQFDLRHVLPW